MTSMSRPMRSGNSVTGYACSECQATLDATNNQTNDGNVSAVANTDDRRIGPHRHHRRERGRQRGDLLRLAARPLSFA